MLLALSGKEVTASSLAAFLTKVGAEADQEKIDQLFKALEGKTIDEVIKEGQGKLLAVGGARGGTAPAAGAAAPAGGAAPAAGKKEEKKEEKEVEVDMGGGNLFGGDEKGDGVSYYCLLFTTVIIYWYLNDNPFIVLKESKLQMQEKQFPHSSYSHIKQNKEKRSIDLYFHSFYYPFTIFVSCTRHYLGEIGKSGENAEMICLLVVKIMKAAMIMQ